MAEKKPRKRTKEEIAQAQKEGNEFIQQREKLAAQFQERGATPKQAQQSATQQIAGKSPQELFGERLEAEQAQAGLFQELKNKQIEEKKKEIGDVDISKLGGETAAASSQLQEQQRRSLIGLPIKEREQALFLQGKSKEEIAQDLKTFGTGVGLFAGGAAALGAFAGGAGATIAAKTAANTLSVKSFIGGGLLSVGGILGKVTANKRQKVRTAKANFDSSINNLNNIINALNSGLISTQDAIENYDTELKNIRIQKNNLEALRKNWISKELSGADDELARIEAFDRRRFILDAQFEQALLLPNSNAPFLGSDTESLNIENDLF